MASKFISAFSGPLNPTTLEAWLGQCEDGFAIYMSTKADKAPDLTVETKIRLTGTQLQEPTMAAWWHAGRKEFLKLTSWEAFEKQIRARFMPKGYKLIALRTFFLCSQGRLSFPDYVSALADARNAVGPTIISASVYKYQLLFHSHQILLLRIMAIPDFDIDSIGFDDLVSLMNMQWESLSAEGNMGRMVSRPAVTSSTSATPAVSQPQLPLLSDAERERLTAAKGCWRCRKVPTDAGWVPHVARTCPGNPAVGLAPGREFVQDNVNIKKELSAFAFSYIDDQDQPDYEDDSKESPFYLDAETSDADSDDFP